MIAELEKCILTKEEIEKWKNQSFSTQDQWPIAV
jgi:hypothetical protein